MDTFGIEKCLIINGQGGPIRRINLEAKEVSTLPVSYTHLDVYKRQDTTIP